MCCEFVNVNAIVNVSLVVCNLLPPPFFFSRCIAIHLTLPSLARSLAPPTATIQTICAACSPVWRSGPIFRRSGAAKPSPSGPRQRGSVRHCCCVRDLRVDGGGLQCSCDRTFAMCLHVFCPISSTTPQLTLFVHLAMHACMLLLLLLLLLQANLRGCAGTCTLAVIFSGR